MYSDLETFDANRVYACFDQPDMKAHFEFTVRAPQEWTVVSNLAADAEGGSPDGEGVRRWQFPPTPLMSTYITHVLGRPVARRALRARRHTARHLLPPARSPRPRPGRDLRGDQAALGPRQRGEVAGLLEVGDLGSRLACLASPENGVATKTFANPIASSVEYIGRRG